MADFQAESVQQSEQIRIEEIFHACLERIIPASMVGGTVVKQKTYWDCWGSILRWVKSQVDLGHSVNVAGLGIISHRVYNLGIRIPIFTMSSKFQVHYGLQAASSRSVSRKAGGPVRRMNHELVAQIAGVDKEIFTVVVANIFDEMGQMMQAGHSLNIDFGVGSLICRDRAVSFYFTQRPDHAPGSKGVSKKKNGPHGWGGSIGGMGPGSEGAKSIGGLSNAPGLRSSIDPQALAGGMWKPQRPPAAPPSESNSAGGRRGRAGRQAAPLTPSGMQQTSANFEPGSRAAGSKSAKKQGPAPSLAEEEKLKELAIQASHGWRYPPILDVHSRTLAASFDDERFARRISNKIGSHYSPDASLMAIDMESIKGGLKSEKARNPLVAEAARGGRVFGAPALMSRSLPADGGGALSVGIDGAVHSANKPAASWRHAPVGFDAEAALTGGKCAAPPKVPTMPSLWDQSNAATAAAQDAVATTSEVSDATVNGGFEPGTSQADATTGSSSVDRAAEQRQAEIRYLHYLKDGVDTDTVAAMKEEWVVNVLELLPSLPQEPDTSVEKLLRRVLQEMKGDYFFSVKKAMLDYMLRSGSERTRLGISEIPVECQPEGWGWGEGKVVPDAPLFWRRNVELAHNCISERLLVTDVHMVEVLSLWQQYAGNLLIKLPSTDDEAQANAWEPQTISQFKDEQIRHARTVTQRLLEEWHPAATAIFKDSMENGTFEVPADKHEKYFEALAVLMSNHIRGLIMSSVEAMVIFFRRYEKEHTTAASTKKHGAVKEQPYSSESTCGERPAFTVKLQVDEKAQTVVFDTAPQDIKRDVLEVFENLVDCLSKIPRVEFKANLSFAQSDSGNGRTELFPVRKDEVVIMEARAYILQVLEQNFQMARKRITLYDEFNFLITSGDEVDEFVEAGTSTNGLEEYAKHIVRFAEGDKRLEQHAPMSMPVTLIQIVCTKVNSELSKLSTDLVQKLLHTISQDNIVRNISLVKKYKVVGQKLSKKPTESTELVDLEQYLDSVNKVEKPELDGAVREVQERLLFLFSHGFSVTDELLQATGTTFKWVKDIPGILKAADDMLSTSRFGIEGKFDSGREEFEATFPVLQDRVDAFNTKADMKQLWEYVDELDKLKEDIQAAKDHGAAINEEEERLGKPVTEFDQLPKISKSLEPYDKLWTTVADYQKSNQAWTKGPIFTLDAEEVDKEVQQMWRVVYKLSKQLAEVAPGVASVALNVKERLDEFKTSIPLIAALCNKGLRDRHWKQMGKVIGFPIQPDDHSSLSRFQDLGVEKYITELDVVAESASKEWSIEKTLAKMKEDFAPMAFELQPYKETGTYVLGGTSLEDITVLLDDHIVKTQTMRGSPYAKPFHDEIGDWDDLLQTMQDMIDEWTACQSTWLYLEPIFSSEDIMKQMPVEGTKFKKVDKTYRGIMDEIFKIPACLKSARIPNVLENLKESNILLEQIQKGLNAYLELKRLYFPRFFFLSNDELLEILAETKDPLRVQPHLKKCFDGLARLEFTDAMTIVAMCSSEKENVPFVEVLDPATARGAVEIWLLDVERVMKDTMKAVCQESIADYPTKSRMDWTGDWPGQLVLSVSTLYFTRDFETACGQDGAAGVSRYLDTLNAYLDDIINAVRGELPKLKRTTLSALTVIDVHARDVMLMLKQNGIDDPTDFDWMSQLRYYWEDGSLQVKMINSVLEYGYEYIGNQGRLVITPLTDRCYRTLMGALHLQYGGAPEGPAGTGKTETVKDLSKALARQCVVFNCSDQLDYLAMAKFFKGLASSGAWACFDEFNRITLEVLSVVAQQITQIQQAIAKRQHEFDFEGTHLNLRWTANVFITMNPGYAGRADLPDNLKVLFRTVAMMVPDYAMIAEIILMSFGYERAKHLSTKITSTYKLCSEQLSYQKHYDYGMRAVMAVIRAAGNLKRKYGQENEEILMLRAINDVNLAKFLSQDLPLFAGITSDLFPGIVLPEPDYVDLLAAVHIKLEETKLQPVDNFLEKIIQLYEMVVVRHGLMVVGEPFAGKTSNIRTLAAALTLCGEKNQMPCAFGDHELATDMILMNPKSVSMNHLYGCFDDVSHEWTDGVLAIQYRKAATADDGRRKWVIFDGPVDAIWIENMNTVLDDNKKLCLNSGEIIQMSAEMTMMFEPKDLEVASPATVSRCGMVFMEPHKLGWRPVVTSWYATLPESIKGNEKLFKSLETMFNWIIDDLLFFVRREVKELAPTSPIMMVNNLLSLFTSLIDEFQDAATIAEIAEKDLLNWLDGIFIFCLTWSLGGTLNNDGREKFDKKVRDMIAGEEGEEPPQKKVTMMMPASGLLYAFTFEKQGKGKWVKWEDTLDKQFAIDPKAQFSAITVPTSDTARYTFLADHLLQHGKQILFVGPTGTGKTIDLHSYLLQLSDDKFQVLETQFSAQTKAIQTQDVIDAKLDKRRKGVFGPAPGKRMMIFVDDLNMPEVEEYGAQPPLELLRQFMDHGGWYDLKDMTFRNLVDIQFCTAMGPPGGGRNHITPRLVRHFNVVGMTEVEAAVLSRIFTTVLNWFVSSKGMSGEVSKFTKAVVDGTLHVFHSSIDNLLPTPAKSHYLFNLRDYARIVQGICMVRASEIGENKQKFCRLWIHECTRVIADRLINDTDKGWFLGMMKETTNKQFGLKFDDVCAQLIPEDAGTKEVTLPYLRNLMWGDYKIAGAEPKLYDEIESMEGIHKVIDEYLDEYNAMATKPMNLVMFNFAIEHTSRLARMFKIPGGNALLVGVGGSGRQSLTRLATYMAEFDCFQIEISKSYGKNEWAEDIKKCLIKAGGEGKPTVFLFTDTQVKYESFVEDINNILNTGEIPNLFPADEKAQIVEMCRGAAKTEGLKIESPGEFYSYFLSRVRDNLHISLCFSPIGEAFRTRLRQFPSLINCCTIDWFTAWPADALQSVSVKFLEEVEFKDDATRNSAMSMCIEFHTSTRDTAARFLDELRRNYYVTPTSYLELISTFKTLIGKKRDEISAAKKRYDIGLDKLITTERSVEGMQVELTDLQPVLITTTKEVEQMMVKVAEEQKGAEGIRTVVQRDEAVAKGKAADSNKIKVDCEADLAEAMPILHAALSALDTLNKSDIVEVKAMKTPPDGVKLTMEALCHFFGVKAIKVKDPEDPTKKIQDYWEPAKKEILSNSNLLKDLKAYDKDNIDPKIVKKMQPYMGNPAFDPDVVKKASKAAFGLCCWARAMVSYDRVAKVVAPKKAKLAEAEAEYAEVMIGLKGKQAELKKVEDKLAELDRQLKGCVDKKKSLELQIQDCIAKLERAEKLIDGLGGEKTRWTAESARLGEVYENLVSDVLLSAGVIAYLGAFTADYRRDIIKQWADASLEVGLTPSEGYSLAHTLGDPVAIRQWNICGLPSDSFSIENGIIVDLARRWPLMIDPQGQANLWVRNMEADAELVVIKLTDSDFLRQLELALQFGKPVLLENIAEELDSALEPILLKQTFKKGGVMMIKLGEALVEYSDQFRFYMTTKMRNPHYLPEVSVKVTLLNFMITPIGLEEQMLGIVVAKEKPELEEEKNRLILESASNKKQLKEIEDKILHVLSSSSGNILDDSTAIEVLTRSKIVSNEIAEKQVIADETEKRIDEARMGYTPVAIRASALFFCISDLANIEPTYQYSLSWFNGIFLYSIENSEKSSVLKTRIDNLCEFFTYMLYKNVCRSLFEKDKLLFSFLLAVKILQAEHPEVVPPAEFRFLLTGGVVTGDIPPNPQPQWLPDSSWGEFYRLSQSLPSLKALADSLKEFGDEWKEIYDADQVHRSAFPGPWNDVTALQRICVVRCIRPDRVVPAIQDFVVNLQESHQIMGQRFIEPPPFDLMGPFEESNSITPLMFILSPGSDPMLTIYKFAEQQGIAVNALSLGQGQGPLAEKMVEKGTSDGSWVILQNCHVYPSWMSTLERICEQFDLNKNHKQFRLWLTSYPSSDLPVAVLQNGVKLTNEPPKGLRANVLGSFLLDPMSDMDFFNGCPDPKTSANFHKLLYGLCFFHAIIQERRKFGPLGWNIGYEFNESDLRISVKQLQMFLNESADKEMPFKALLYITGQCNYGGRVTDPFDRTCLVAILKHYYCDGILDDSYKLSASGTYKAPPDDGYEATLDAIRALPLGQDPEVFGMHSNADITKDQGETYGMLESIMSTQARATGGGGDGPEATVDKAAADMMQKLPSNFDVEVIQMKYPVLYEESMNTVLCQELTRFNGLLSTIRSSLTDVKKAIVGLVVMSASLEKVFDSVYDGKIPLMWKGVSYPSLKALGGYFADLVIRLKFFQSWVDNGMPITFWLSGFFFTQAFLTGGSQNFARIKTIPIDTLGYSFKFMEESHAEVDKMPKPEFGVYTYGLYLEGAKWHHDQMMLGESEPKELFTACPIIWMRPCVAKDIPEFPHYNCPLYKTSDRRGILSTTGHSTNFVMPIQTPSNMPQEHWIKRGVAMLTQLDT